MSRVDNFTANPDFLEENEEHDSDFYAQFFEGPQFNVEVKRSTLSDQIGYDMYGLFARERIPKENLVGIYKGLVTFGGTYDTDGTKYSSFKRDVS